MKKKETEEDFGIDFRYILPFAILFVLMLIPYSLNFMAHQITASRQPATPVVMKFHLVRQTAITVPSEAVQFEDFNASVNLNTQRLADLINNMRTSAIGGATIHGIAGIVSPDIKVTMSGETFTVEEQRSQAQLSASDEETNWNWHVQPQSSGHQTVKFYLHLLTHTDGVNKTEVIEIAEAKIAVKVNPSGWILRNWEWVLVLLFTTTLIGWKLRRWLQLRASHSDS